MSKPRSSSLGPLMTDKANVSAQRRDKKEARNHRHQVASLSEPVQNSLNGRPCPACTMSDDVKKMLDAIPNIRSRKGGASGNSQKIGPNARSDDDTRRFSVPAPIPKVSDVSICECDSEKSFQESPDILDLNRKGNTEHISNEDLTDVNSLRSGYKSENSVSTEEKRGNDQLNPHSHNSKPINFQHQCCESSAHVPKRPSHVKQLRVVKTPQGGRMEKIEVSYGSEDRCNNPKSSLPITVNQVQNVGYPQVDDEGSEADYAKNNAANYFSNEENDILNQEEYFDDLEDYLVNNPQTDLDNQTEYGQAYHLPQLGSYYDSGVVDRTNPASYAPQGRSPGQQRGPNQTMRQPISNPTSKQHKGNISHESNAFPIPSYCPFFEYDLPRERQLVVGPQMPFPQSRNPISGNCSDWPIYRYGNSATPRKSTQFNSDTRNRSFSRDNRDNLSKLNSPKIERNADSMPMNTDLTNHEQRQNARVKGRSKPKDTVALPKPVRASTLTPDGRQKHGKRRFNTQCPAAIINPKGLELEVPNVHLQQGGHTCKNSRILINQTLKQSEDPTTFQLEYDVSQMAMSTPQGTCKKCNKKLRVIAEKNASPTNTRRENRQNNGQYFSATTRRRNRPLNKQTPSLQQKKYNYQTYDVHDSSPTCKFCLNICPRRVSSIGRDRSPVISCQQITYEEEHLLNLCLACCILALIFYLYF